MSDSESESRFSTAAPSDEKLEEGLRKTVAEIFETGNMEQLTVKRVRSATEQALGLDDGFFKTDPDWKSRSDRIIRQEAVRPATIRIMECFLFILFFFQC